MTVATGPKEPEGQKEGKEDEKENISSGVQRNY